VTHSSPPAVTNVMTLDAWDAPDGRRTLLLDERDDCITLPFSVNGTQVATRALTGSLTAGTQPLSIGGNSVWGEWFQGRIDEVRVPNRVLSAADLQGDMARAVSGGA
jgi:hypothetical protein